MKRYQGKGSCFVESETLKKQQRLSFNKRARSVIEPDIKLNNGLKWEINNMKFFAIKVDNYVNGTSFKL